MKKALVTGANGFIGSALVHELINNSVEVIAVVRKSKKNLPEKVRVIECDLNESDILFELIPDRDIDVLYHMAWNGSSGDLRSNYGMQLKNAQMTCDVVKTAAKMGIKKFVGAGTIAQYDCLAYVGANDSVPALVSCYASAKIAAQYMSKAVANAKGIEHVWCVISNSFGLSLIHI